MNVMGMNGTINQIIVSQKVMLRGKWDLLLESASL